MPYTKHLPKIFTEEEISLIADTIMNSPNYLNNEAGDFLRWRDITAIELMFYCGLRPYEALQLKWEDIDFEKDLIYVRPYINKIKNDLPAILTIPAKKILIKYKQKLEEFNMNNPWLFPSFWSWTPICSGTMNRRFLNACKEAGIAHIEYYRDSGQPKYNIHLYCLRHSFATKIYKATHSEIAVARLCRHTKVESASVYTHLDFDDKQQIADSVFN